MTTFSKIVMIDCQVAGVAGDMFLGALLDLGDDVAGGRCDNDIYVRAVGYGLNLGTGGLHRQGVNLELAVDRCANFIDPCRQ